MSVVTPHDIRIHPPNSRSTCPAPSVFARCNSRDICRIGRIRWLAGRTRIYLHHSAEGGLLPAISRVGAGAFEVTFASRSLLHRTCLKFIARWCLAVYLHSIYPLHDGFYMRLYRLARKRILDVHGIVPEEILLLGDKEQSAKFAAIEAVAVGQAHWFISVTQAMTEHIAAKYLLPPGGRFIHLPTLQAGETCQSGRKEFTQRVVYCGGLQRWQQVEMMLQYVHAHPGWQFAFLVPQPEKLEAQYLTMYQTGIPAKVTSASIPEVAACYAKSSYGLIFREDIPVNRVACPTKLLEYLQHDIIPVVDTDCIGDFKMFGYRYVSRVEELPNEAQWQEMLAENRKVLAKIREVFQQGLARLQTAL